MLLGYARVSTDDQDCSLQLQALKRVGCQRVYSEKTSSVSARPELRRVLTLLQVGDVLVVYKLDRIARSLRDLLNILEQLETIGAGVRSVTEPISTDNAAGRLMLQMLGAVAEFERSLIRERTVAGLEAVKARGVKLGRERSMRPADEKLAVDLYLTGEYSYVSLADYFGVSKSTIKRAVYRVTKPWHSSLR